MTQPEWHNKLAVLTAPYRDEAGFCVLPAPHRAQTPRPRLGERSSHYGDTTLTCMQTVTFHAVEARRREEREMGRHFHDDPVFRCDCENFPGAGQRKSLVSRGGREKKPRKRQRLVSINCMPACLSVFTRPFMLIFWL